MSNQQQIDNHGFQIREVVLSITGTTFSLAQKTDFYNYVVFKTRCTWLCVEDGNTRTIMMPLMDPQWEQNLQFLRLWILLGCDTENTKYLITTKGMKALFAREVLRKIQDVNQVLGGELSEKIVVVKV